MQDLRNHNWPNMRCLDTTEFWASCTWMKLDKLDLDKVLLFQCCCNFGLKLVLTHGCLWGPSLCDGIHLRFVLHLQRAWADRVGGGKDIGGGFQLPTPAVKLYKSAPKELGPQSLKFCSCNFCRENTNPKTLLRRKSIHITPSFSVAQGAFKEM